MTCTFFGHRDFPREMQPALQMQIADLIAQKGADRFYVGNQGGFDFAVLQALRACKAIYPQIEYSVVLAYMPRGTGSCLCGCKSRRKATFLRKIAEIAPRALTFRQKKGILGKSNQNGSERLLKTKLKGAELALIASMLFGLFFGAGNLIFPIRMGQLAGANIWIAFIGLLITAVGLPLLGVASIGISRSDGLIELAGKVSRGYSIFFTCALYLTIGPFFAIPRCGATSFTIGMANMLGDGAYTDGVLVVFSLLFFLAVLVLSLNPGEILTWVGKVLTPLFLVFLGALVVSALVNPMGNIAEMSPQDSYATQPFVTGFLEGYNTMDALASLAFGIVVITVIRDLGVTEPGAVAAHTVKAGVFSCLFMGLIYLAVAVVGAETGILYADCKDGGEIFARVAEHYFEIGRASCRERV